MSDEQQKIELATLAPEHWFNDRSKSSIWLAAYRILHATKDHFTGGVFFFDLDNVRGMPLLGSLNYFDGGTVSKRYDLNSKMTVEMRDPKFSTTDEGMYLILMSPFRIDGVQLPEPLVKSRIQSTVGLLGAINGRNMVFEHLFDNVLDLSENKTSAFSPVFENPAWFSAVDLSPARRGTINTAGTLISALPTAEKNRVNLSLRWFESALYDSGVDSFLKQWIALETLAMPDTTNVQPLTTKLASAYGISEADARDKFKVGRLFGLRSRIVHGGQICPIHGMLSKYMEAVFVDALLERLGMPSERRTEAVLADPHFSLTSYLHE